MENEKRLIELVRNVRRKITAWHTTEDIADMLIANDVVPVVRCKDCKHHDHCEVETFLRYVDRIDNPYCASGERKNND